MNKLPTTDEHKPGSQQMLHPSLQRDGGPLYYSGPESVVCQPEIDPALAASQQEMEHWFGCFL